MPCSRVGSLPDRSAATPTAPAPSTTSFDALEQEHHRLGDLVLVDEHDLVDERLDELQRQRGGTLDRDPVGDRPRRIDGNRCARRERGRQRGACGDLDAEDLDLRALGLERDRDPADQSAAADRDDDAR